MGHPKGRRARADRTERERGRKEKRRLRHKDGGGGGEEKRGEAIIEAERKESAFARFLLLLLRGEARRGEERRGEERRGEASD